MDIRDEIDLVRRTRAAHMWRSPTESWETSAAAITPQHGYGSIVLKRKGRVIGIYRYRYRYRVDGDRRQAA